MFTSNNRIIHTSTEHEREMLPTTTSGDDGLERSNTSKSESESYNTTLLQQILWIKININTSTCNDYTKSTKIINIHYQ